MNLPADPAVYLTPLAILTLVASFIQIRKSETDLAKRKKEIDQKIYETLILREIGERIGYELNLSKILDTIVGSLNKLIPFSVISYALWDPGKNKIDLRFHLEETVNRGFLEEMKNQMLAKLGRNEEILETVTGTIIDEGIKDKLASLWLLPLTINEQNMGILAVANKRAGLYKGPEMEILNKILAQANRAVANLEKVLATEEEKLNTMVASMSDGVLMLDANLGLAVINPAAAGLLGLKTDKKLTILDVAESLANKLDLRTKIEESQQKNALVTFDNLTIGDKISKLLISPVKDATGKVLGTVVLFHDITVQKELEKVREEFTAMMVHELRAPLTVVRGTADMIFKNPTMTAQPQGLDLLKTMENSAGTMLSLVNDLLDVAKIEAGKFQIIKVKNNLTEIIKDRITFFGQLAQPKSIALSSDFVEQNLEAECDKERTSQVLNNLLSNAIKFTPVGGRVILSAYHINNPGEIRWRFPTNKPAVNFSGPAVLISVSDTGEGIPEEQLPELFSKFKQLKPSEKGTGLGLTIAKGIIESHGGAIFVQSQSSEGTTFYFTLPI